MVFLDEKGDKIQAIVKKLLIRRFSHLFAEGQFRVINNFGVAQNNGSYRLTSHPYKINFLLNTRVQNCDDLPIPLHGLNFASFDDIISNRLDDIILTDVVGEIVSVIPIETFERNGKQSKKLILELNDKE